jgi:Zn finger protein HypA/HybF involved in hydrogenase expression
MSKRRYSDIDLSNAVKVCYSYNQVSEYLKPICGQRAQIRTLKMLVKRLNLNVEHFHKYHNSSQVEKPLEQILIEHSTYANTSRLKKKIIKAGLLKNECTICKNNGMWENKTLSLQLDHINGIPDDHRIENLRILCPNCHSQTDNYVGKNKRKT